ncbi:uncharacterized protein LOC115924905 [Strongylocentrotus purpuratus]|uniref:Solute-binding protein family 3/N-terminal domain-containing protein n=1 Tax=Strongylocentrotus purpuratus TaxID=7668 RepID=A0A7M7NYX4_STRPU|nr:uncharacterized protein LOC115924905 [Strongylocentrotus purpuratus]
MAQDRNLLTVILVCCLTVVSIVALVLGIISLNQSGGETGSDGQPINIFTQSGQSSSSGSSLASSSSSDDKVWLFAIGHYDDILEYLDETTYTIKGFGPDIVDAVCSIANKNCQLVYDVYEHCWDNQAGERPRGGPGLMGGWYDGCTGWVQTLDRLLTYYFTVPYTNGRAVALFAKNDSTVTYNDLTNLTVGFLDGWNSDEFCLARYKNIVGSTLSANQIFHYQSADLMIDAVLNGVIDVAFGELLSQFTSSLKLISPPDFDNNCQAGGASIMTRHTNRDLVNWWNDAFQRLRDRGRYNEICEAIPERHGHIAGQDYTEICLGY